jgi:hypothetical protein
MPPIFSVFSKLKGLMSVNQANAQKSGNQVIFYDMVALLIWPATITAFTKGTSMTVTPTSTQGGSPPAAVTFALNGEGTAALPLFALN